MTSDFSKHLENHQALSSRLTYSTDFLSKAKAKTSDVLGSGWKDVAIFAAGSLGRFETGRSSDLDVFMLAKPRDDRTQINSPISHLDEIRLFSMLIDINRQLALPEFSGDGRYLKVHSLDRIISSTGDAHDDSENLFTTRLLLLLESKALWNESLRQEAVKSVLDNYFKDGKGKRDFRPLFLLNDILRYWRTLCLNYERDRVKSEKWWKTNLNLKFSRKLTIFSTVLLILTKGAQSQSDFEAVANMVPLQRLAQALDALDDTRYVQQFAAFLDDYESFLAAKSFAELEDPSREMKEEFRNKASCTTSL
jgi:predicted nucleotidyltransferase